MRITWEAENQVPAHHAVLAGSDRINEIDARFHEIAPGVWERHQMEVDKAL